MKLAQGVLGLGKGSCQHLFGPGLDQGLADGRRGRIPHQGDHIPPSAPTAQLSP